MSRHLDGTMSLNPLESMLQSIMTSLFNPDQQSIVVCSRCSKTKRAQGQQSSPTNCRCDRNRSERKNKRRRRKLKKTCLKTIVCVAKMAKNSDECLDCACLGCSGNTNHEDEDDRFCSKCGQLLPGESSADPHPPLIPSIHLPSTESTTLQECREQLELCRSEYDKINNIDTIAIKTVIDRGVQVNIERKEPMSVRIRVCSCYTGTKFQGDLTQSKSEPDMSKANIAYDGDDSSERHVSGSHTLFEDYYNTAPHPQLPDSGGPKGTEAWENVRSPRKQKQQKALPRGYEEAERELLEAPKTLRQTVEFDGDPRISHRAHWTVENDPATQPPGQKSAISRAFVEPSNRDEPRNPGWKRSLGLLQYNQHHPCTQNNQSPVECCTGTGVYCYSAQNTSSCGRHCENKCSCTRNGTFYPYQPYV